MEKIILSAPAKLNLTLDILRRREDGRWEPVRYSIVPVDDTVAPDAEISTRLDQYREKINTEYLVNFGYTYDQVLAVSDVNFKQFSDFGQGLGGEPLGSIIADAYLTIFFAKLLKNIEIGKI